MKIDAAKFHIGQMVFFAPDTDSQGVVTAITFSAAGIMYNVAWNDFGERQHYDVELTTEQTFVKKSEE